MTGTRFAGLGQPNVSQRARWLAPLSIILASLITLIPFKASVPLLPPFGLMMLLAAAGGCVDGAEESPAYGQVQQALAFEPSLPWPSGEALTVTQGWNGGFSHQGNLYYAIDFAGAGVNGMHALSVGDGQVVYRHDACTCDGCSCNGSWSSC